MFVKERRKEKSKEETRERGMEEKGRKKGGMEGRRGRMGGVKRRMVTETLSGGNNTQPLQYVSPLPPMGSRFNFLLGIEPTSAQHPM